MQKPMLGEMIDWSDPINQGLVLLLRLNEGMGDHVSDLSLNDNHGTLENFTHPGTKTSGWTPGFRGKTIAFDGSDDYIDCGNNPSLDITDAITISVWYKADTPERYLICKNDLTAADSQYGIFLQGSTGSFTYAPTGGLASANNSIKIGEWQHVLLTRTGAGVGQFYVDGIVSGASHAIDMPTNAFTVNIGRRKPNNYYFDGSIDEVRIYNRALLPSEITRLYMEGMPSKSTTHAYPNYFVFDCATTGAVETFALPLEATGTYDFEVHWGDGTWDIITAWNAAAATHTYASAGTHQIVIDGHIEGFRFNNAGDCAKVRDVSAWGCLLPGNSNAYFYGCSGLTVSATDILNLTGTTDFERSFRNCSSLTTVPSMNSWDVSNISTLRSMFVGASNFNQNIEDWDVSNVANMQDTFNSTSFDQNIGSWDITSMTDATSMFNGVTLSTANYDALLVGWEAQVEQPNVVFHAGNSKYSAGAAATARAALQANGWNITDGGAA